MSRTPPRADPAPPELQAMLPALRKRARRLTQSVSDADDLMQEALVRVLQKLDAGHAIDALPAYAMRTLHNLARMRWRAPQLLDALEDDHATVLPCAMLRLECAEVLAAIEGLPPEQAEVMRLICAGETSPAAMAVALQVPPGTVMSRLARARARLRRKLG